jgi:uncharacterized protein YcfJ
MRNVVMQVLAGEESEIRQLVQREAREDGQLLASLKYGAAIGAVIGGVLLAWVSRGGEGGLPAAAVLTCVGAIGGAFAGAFFGSVILRVFLK